jgi:hypothetical protein
MRRGESATVDIPQGGLLQLLTKILYFVLELGNEAPRKFAHESIN